MPLRSISNTFNRGELDPNLYARDDIDIYSKGARKLRNMIPLWTGAARIAPGTKYIDTIVDRENANAIIDDADNVRSVDFLYDADDDIIYTLVLRKSGSSSALDIYYNDTLQTTITSTPYTTAQIKDVYFTAAHDRILLLHESVQIRELVRGASHSSWTLATLNFRVPPTYDYSVIGKATNYRTFTFTLGATSGSGVSLTSSSAVFTRNHVNGLFVGNGGIARITAVGSTTGATVRILDDFVSTTVRGELASLQEKMWTSGGGSPTGQDRGWPARGAFYLNRLMLGRSKELQNVVAVSTSGVFDNFDNSELDALSSFSVSFNGRGEQTIQSIVADDSVIFTTTGKIFAQSPLVSEQLSATNVYFAPQTQSPSAAIEAVTVDNQVLFVSSNQSQVMSVMYNTNDAKYLSSPANQLSNHLFQTVNSNGSWEPKGVTARMYLATQDNGSMLIYSTLSEQQVSGWSLRTTRGKFKSVIADGRQASVIVQRQINLGTSTFETAMDYVFLSDSTFEAFYDVTDDFDPSVSAAIGVFENDDEYILLGNEIPFTAIDITLNTVSSDDCDLQFQYLDTNGFWNTFTPTDNTTGFTSSASITWTFDDVLNWEPNTINDIEDTYWIRIKRQADSVTTNPIVEDLEVNTGIRLYLERMGFDLYTDSTENTTSDSAGLVTGLDHLKGHQVYAIENGATSGPYFVDSSGETTIKNLSATVDIGIQYKPLLVPMPLFTPTQEGDNTYAQKYVQNLFIDYVDSLYLRAGAGETLTDIPNMKLGNFTLGQVVQPQTGIYPIEPRGNWSPRQELIITQSQPGPMTIIGVGYHVEVS